jgi:hypothetical protein
MPRPSRRAVWIRRALAVALLAATLWTVPHRLCAREADDWFRGDADAQAALERGVEEIVARPLTRGDFPTGSRVLDGEWLFGTYMMAAMGFGQLALEHPERRAHELALMRPCIDKMISAKVRAFDAEAWGGDDPLDGLDGDAADHGSYLGYLDLALSLERLLDRDNPHARLNDRVTAALARRLGGSRSLLLESYPGEVFPVDNGAVIGAIALHDRATGGDHAALIARFSAKLRERSIDARTGLLRQTMPGGTPRGSGTAFAAYFLGWADPKLSAELYDALKRELFGTALGFGGVREYPRGHSGRGDADSGPLILGFSVAATGFAVGAARMHGDGALYARLFSTVQLFGAPRDGSGRRHYLMGGPIGNAIMFAMLTAPRLPR